MLVTTTNTASGIGSNGSMSMPVKVNDGQLTETMNQDLTIRFRTENARHNMLDKSNIFYDAATRTVNYYNNSSNPMLRGNGYSYFQLDDSASVDSKFNYGTGTLILDFATNLAWESLRYTLNGLQEWTGNIRAIFGGSGEPG